MKRMNRKRPFRAHCRGYSFTEVMFAVVVLGIGFIMIAAMFPVAISQSKLTQEETNAAAIARGAATYVQSVASRYNMPATGTAAQPTRPRVYSVRDIPGAGGGQGTGITPRLDALFTVNPAPFNVSDTLWSAVKGNLILPSDPRYGFVVLYSRAGTPGIAGAGNGYAQLFVVACQVRARSTYGPNPDLTFNGADPVNLQARPVTINIVNNVNSTGVDWITFTERGQAGALTAIAEGTYVIVANDPGSAAPNAGLFNGRIYRVGAPATDLGSGAPPADTWELQAGSDYTQNPGPDNDIATTGDNIDIGADAGAWIVGREPDTETAPATDYRGTAQDISIYTTFVSLR
jgi:hypothetical protein